PFPVCFLSSLAVAIHLSFPSSIPESFPRASKPYSTAASIRGGAMAAALSAAFFFQPPDTLSTDDTTPAAMGHGLDLGTLSVHESSQDGAALGPSRSPGCRREGVRLPSAAHASGAGPAQLGAAAPDRAHDGPWLSPTRCEAA
ncbi:unnamed protein product, partial [Urochloa humidicola]